MAPIINMVMMPVLLLSGILLPMTSAPSGCRRSPT
jgi:ABC-2 type transport system permease protein